MEAEFDSDFVARFTWIDYCVFSVMLAISACIGLYYGCVGRGMQDTKDFLMAGKSMSGFPVAMSLIASFISAISLLGTPSEIYQTGIAYGQIFVAYMTAIPLSGYVFLPVFWKMQLTSSFEYLEKRFSRPVRVLGSILFIIVMNVYMAFVIYAPALALAHVTGVNVFLSVSLITFVSMFYTALGGMKAVLWTDALQMVIMFGGVLLVVIKGTIDLGGLGRVWEINTMGNRTDFFDLSFDPRVRHTLWGMSFGQFFYWFSVFGVNQTQVQRYLCVSKLQTAKNLLWMSGIGFVIVIGLSCVIGLQVYANYIACDPIVAGVVSKPDQLLPLYIMDHFGEYRGFPGLFIAGIFSGALSTVSSGINSLVAITLEDFVRKWFPNMTEKKATLVSKFMSVGYGIVAFLLVIIASQLGDVLSTTNTVTGIIYGQILAIFSLGMLFPSANAKGTFIGTFVGSFVAGWLVFGQQLAVKNKQLALGKLPINVCDNFTVIDDMTPSEIMDSFNMYQQEAEILVDELDHSILTEIYRISYVWSTMIGCVLTILVGLTISKITGSNDYEKMDPDLISPAVFLFKGTCSFVGDIGKDFKPDIESELQDKPETNNSVQDYGSQQTDISKL